MQCRRRVPRPACDGTLRCPGSRPRCRGSDSKHLWPAMFGKKVQVFVCDEPPTIIVSRRLTARWVASGVYMGKSLTVEDQTEAGALARWRSVAESTAALALASSG